MHKIVCPTGIEAQTRNAESEQHTATAIDLENLLHGCSCKSIAFYLCQESALVSSFLRRHSTHLSALGSSGRPVIGPCRTVAAKCQDNSRARFCRKRTVHSASPNHFFNPCAKKVPVFFFSTILRKTSQFSLNLFLFPEKTLDTFICTRQQWASRNRAL
jgi:hypothetical protein